jgi:hypothetical protein
MILVSIGVIVSLVIIRAGMAPQLILLRAIEGRAVLKVDLSV